jgi:hypothetical protein
MFCSASFLYRTNPVQTGEETGTAGVCQPSGTEGLEAGSTATIEPWRPAGTALPSGSVVAAEDSEAASAVPPGAVQVTMTMPLPPWPPLAPVPV